LLECAASSSPTHQREDIIVRYFNPPVNTREGGRRRRGRRRIRRGKGGRRGRRGKRRRETCLPALFTQPHSSEEIN
jgi:hypothetical protein